jgi:hypothetical protein
MECKAEREANTINCLRIHLWLLLLAFDAGFDVGFIVTFAGKQIF